MKNVFVTALLLFSLNIRAQVFDSTKHTLSLSHDYSHFEKQFEDDWHITSLEYKRQLSNGAILGRINYGNRFQQGGWQGELEAYPKFSKKVYAYIGAGYSNGLPVFPGWRSGASLYVSLPKAWELEGGFRQLHFTESIWLGTAGLSKYLGNWLFNFRAFVGFDDLSNNQSYFVSARRYFKNEADYAWLQIGSGISPDESRNIQMVSTSSLSSMRFVTGTKFSVSKRAQLLLSAGWFRNEYQKSLHDNQINTTIGISQRF